MFSLSSIDNLLMCSHINKARPNPLSNVAKPTFDLPPPIRPTPTVEIQNDLIPATETEALELDSTLPIDARPPSISKATSIQPTKDPADISSLLQHHREVQDTLTEDLAAMAKQLKLNTLLFSSSLEKDKSLLEDADNNLSGNYDVMQKERARLGAYSKSGNWTTCYVIMAVAAVGAAWVCES